MPDKSTIPFGPQHPVLPEPIQLKLTLEDENVKEALPALGYIHRGIEKMAEKQDYDKNIFLVERVCGICSSTHALAYCLALEELLQVEAPPRAELLRVIWAELHRAHSHFLWLGLLAEAVGFESLFMQLWKVRERVMDVLELTAGNRVIISVSKVGGTRRDISEENLKLIMKTLDELQKEMDEILPTLLNNYTLKKRTQGIGAIPADQCRELGAVGPTLRASGVAEDMRMKGYGGYKLLPFEPITETNGDAYARALVRAKELYQTFDLIRDAIKELSNHGPEIDTKVKGRPKGSSMVRIEAPRGEVMYLLVGNGSKKLERMRVRVPTFANVPMLLTMLPGEDFSNVPTLTLSIDPCISCTER